jgi:hypothetical protein
LVVAVAFEVAAGAGVVAAIAELGGFGSLEGRYGGALTGCVAVRWPPRDWRAST